ncbi:TPA: hypothetical protein ACH3X2_013383 [Trebouxia sp. C0005]
MATELARIIVAEAHAQRRSKMITSMTQSRAILLVSRRSLVRLRPHPLHNNNLDEDHLVRDVYVRTWAQGKGVKGIVVLKGLSPAFENTNKAVLAVFLSQSFLTEARDEEAAAV